MCRVFRFDSEMLDRQDLRKLQVKSPHIHILVNYTLIKHNSLLMNLCCSHMEVTIQNKQKMHVQIPQTLKTRPCTFNESETTE